MILKRLARLCACAAVLAVGPGAAPLLDPIGLQSDAFAQDRGKKKKRSIPNINEATWRRLSDAQELVDAEQWTDARTMLTTMVERARRYNGNELAQMHNLLAYCAYELGDIEATIRHYEQVLAQVPDIAEALEDGTLNQLSKLYFQEGNKYEGEQAAVWYRKALDTMMRWMANNENPGPEAHFYLAQIYYQMKDFPNAIDRLETVVALARERGLKVKENWWTMLQYLYFEQENWPKVIEILEILVKDYPKRAYWVNLASVYGETDQIDKQLWTLEAAHAGGYLTAESDIRTFGGLLLQQEIPNRATIYLQKGFDDEIVEPTVSNLSTLGQAYQLAQDVDPAISVFEEAAKLAEDGTIYDRLSALYLEKDQFSECVDAGENALAKGDLKKPILTRITIGICQFNLDRLTDSRKTFVGVRQEARRDRSRTEERTASQWITYIDSESRRRAELARR